MISYFWSLAKAYRGRWELERRSTGKSRSLPKHLLMPHHATCPSHVPFSCHSWTLKILKLPRLGHQLIPNCEKSSVFQQTTKSGTWGADSHRSCFTFGCKPVSQMLCKHFRWGRLNNFGPLNEAEMLGNEAKNSSFTGDRLGWHDTQRRQHFFESEHAKIHYAILHKAWLDNKRCNLM